jgi:hypothetical protein
MGGLDVPSTRIAIQLDLGAGALRMVPSSAVHPGARLRPNWHPFLLPCVVIWLDERTLLQV